MVSKLQKEIIKKKGAEKRKRKAEAVKELKVNKLKRDLKGEEGNKGNTGNTGVRGDIGEKGNEGDKGPKGDRGEKGEKGDTGSSGVGIKGDIGGEGKDAPTIEALEIDEKKVITTLSDGTTLTGKVTIKFKESQQLGGIHLQRFIDVISTDGTVTVTKTNVGFNLSVDHDNILNNGTNTHAQIDTHIADATIHFTEASIDHDNILNNGTTSHALLDDHVDGTDTDPHSEHVLLVGRSSGQTQNGGLISSEDMNIEPNAAAFALSNTGMNNLGRTTWNRTFTDTAASIIQNYNTISGTWTFPNSALTSVSMISDSRIIEFGSAQGLFSLAPTLLSQPKYRATAAFTDNAESSLVGFAANPVYDGAHASGTATTTNFGGYASSPSVINTGGGATVVTDMAGYMTHPVTFLSTTVGAGATVNTYSHFKANSPGNVSGTLTNNVGFDCENLTKGTNDIAFQSNQSFGGGNRAMNMLGNAPSTFKGSLRLEADNIFSFWGASNDVFMAYNGTDFVINPQFIGSGDFIQSAGNFNLNGVGMQLQFTSAVTLEASNLATSSLKIAGGAGSFNESLILEFNTAANRVAINTDTGVTALRFRSNIGIELGNDTGVDIRALSGVFSMTGIGNTNNETLDLDFETTANEIGVSSSAAGLNFGVIDNMFGDNAGNVYGTGDDAFDSWDGTNMVRDVDSGDHLFTGGPVNASEGSITATRTTTGNDTITSADHDVIFDITADAVCTLPDPTGNAGQRFLLIGHHSNTTHEVTFSEDIAGDSSFALLGNEEILIKSSGTEYN